MSSSEFNPNNDTYEYRERDSFFAFRSSSKTKRHRNVFPTPHSPEMHKTAGLLPVRKRLISAFVVSVDVVIVSRAFPVGRMHFISSAAFCTQRGHEFRSARKTASLYTGVPLSFSRSISMDGGNQVECARGVLRRKIGLSVMARSPVASSRHSWKGRLAPSIVRRIEGFIQQL